jgi:hypothetical protein
LHALLTLASETRSVIIEIGRAKHDVKSLSYHEHLSRKLAMVPKLDKMKDILESLQKLEGVTRTVVGDSETEFEWALEGKAMSEVEHFREELELSSRELKRLFADIDTMLLCNLEDHIRIIINETREKQRSTSVLSSWDELEAELADEQDISEDDVRTHQKAILSFLRLEVEEWFISDNDGSLHTRSGSIGNVSSIMAISELSPADEQQPDPGTSLLGKSRSSVTESDSFLSLRMADAPKPRPKRISVLFVDLNNTGTSYFSRILVSPGSTYRQVPAYLLWTGTLANNLRSVKPTSVEDRYTSAISFSTPLRSTLCTSPM